MILYLITFGFILSLSSFISYFNGHSVDLSKKTLGRVCKMAHHNFDSLRIDALSACYVVCLSYIWQLICETPSV